MVNPLNSYVGRIADHRVEAAGPHDLRELGVPVEGVDAVRLLVIQQPQAHLPAFVEVRPDQRVAALDVVPQVGKGTLLHEAELSRQAAGVLSLQHLQQQRELGDLHRLTVDVDAVDVVQQNTLPLGGRQVPLVIAGLVEARVPATRPLLRVVAAVVIDVPVE